MTLDEYAKNFYNNIETLSRLFSVHRATLADSAAFRAAFEGHRVGKTKFSCKIDKLEFRLKNTSKLCNNSDGKMSLFINSTLEMDLQKTDGLSSILKYSLEIFAIDIKGKIFFWHLDQHNFSGDTNLIHPYYHLHFGGNRIKETDSGNLLLLKTPRIAHPPLDPFLCIHYIIVNFYEVNAYPWIKEIQNDSSYISIIKKSENLFWMPFFDALSYQNSDGELTFNRLFPMTLSGAK